MKRPTFASLTIPNSVMGMVAEKPMPALKPNITDSAYLDSVSIVHGHTHVQQDGYSVDPNISIGDRIHRLGQYAKIQVGSATVPVHHICPGRMTTRSIMVDGIRRVVKDITSSGGQDLYGTIRSGMAIGLTPAHTTTSLTGIEVKTMKRAAITVMVVAVAVIGGTLALTHSGKSASSAPPIPSPTDQTSFTVVDSNGQVVKCPDGSLLRVKRAQLLALPTAPGKAHAAKTVDTNRGSHGQQGLSVAANVGRWKCGADDVAVLDTTP